jgi:hypothetical protein
MDFEAFRAATSNIERCSGGRLKGAFLELDIDGDGLISEMDLERVRFITDLDEHLLPCIAP